MCWFAIFWWRACTGLASPAWLSASAAQPVGRDARKAAPGVCKLLPRLLLDTGLVSARHAASQIELCWRALDAPDLFLLSVRAFECQHGSRE